MSAIVLDTETTSVDSPEVIELAYATMETPSSNLGDTMLLRYQPTVPIALGAMATHNIIPEDLEGCDPWPGSWAPPAELSSLDYIVGHNVDFDWRAIGEPKIRRICTLALARKAFPSLDSHTLGALTYHQYPAPMARRMLKDAHSAAADVDLCHKLLLMLFGIFRPRDWNHLWEISEQARVPTVMSFGKYGPKDGQPGMPIAQMRKQDPGYVRWLLNNADIVKGCPYWQKALTA